MLNDHEQRQLDRIEEALLRDAHLSACFQRDWRASLRRVAPGPRCLVLPGVLIMAASMVLGLGGPFAQGVGLVGFGLTWSIATNPVARRRVKRFLMYSLEAYERSWTEGRQS